MSNECTCAALRMAARRLTQVYDAALAAEGLNTPQYALLSRLGDPPNGAPTVRQMADRLGLDRTTLARNLRPLEREGLVTIAPDAEDRRVRRIRLTPAGRARRAACLPLWRAVQQSFTRDFGSARTADLMAALRSIAEIRPLTRAAAPSQENHDAG